MTAFILYRKSDGRITGSAKARHEDPTVFESDEIGAIIAELPDISAFKVSQEGQIVPVESGDFSQEDLENKRSSALAQTRDKIANKRTKYITDLPGQDAIYQAKENEAVAYLADPSPDMADYPLLSAETGITAPTATELANLWTSMAQQWRSVAAQLEAVRMTTNTSIGSATTVAGVDAALAALDAALTGLPQP